jgi:inactivated superfamily I helicase
LPKIKAIADISIHDFFDSFPKAQIQAIVDELSQTKVLSGFDYLFFLSQEIVKTKVFGENINFSQALNIALQLKNLFDEIERQEIDIESLYKIDDSDLAAHRQFTLEFLQKFYLRIKNSILKNNVILPISYQK